MLAIEDMVSGFIIMCITIIIMCEHSVALHESTGKRVQAFSQVSIYKEFCAKPHEQFIHDYNWLASVLSYWI